MLRNGKEETEKSASQRAVKNKREGCSGSKE